MPIIDISAYPFNDMYLEEVGLDKNVCLCYKIWEYGIYYLYNQEKQIWEKPWYRIKLVTPQVDT